MGEEGEAGDEGKETKWEEKEDALNGFDFK